MMMEFSDYSHCGRVLHTLSNQRQKKECCDVVIHVDKQSFYAHQNVLSAVSPYMRDLMISCDIQTSDELFLTCDMNYMSPSSVEQLLEYCYTGRVLITEHNVEDLLRGSKDIALQCLRTHCIEFLHLTLNKDNCVHVLTLANDYDLKDLTEKAYSYIRDQFFLLATTKQMMDSPYSIFSRLIKDEELCAENEEQVLSSLLMWTKQNLEERGKYFEKLFFSIQLGGVPEKTLTVLRDEEPLIKNISNCMGRVNEALGERKEKDNISPSLLQKEGALLDAVIVLGGQKADGTSSSAVYAYLIQADRWLKLTDMPYKAAALSATCSGKYIYITGGTNEQSCSLKTAWKYDIFSNTWTKLPDLPMGLVFHSMVMCKESVYTIGGSLAPRKYISTIFRYDDRKEKWISFGKMSFSTDCAEVISKGDKYIYIVTGRCMVNGHISRVGVVNCFDVDVGEVKRSLTFPIQFKHRPLISFQGENILYVQSHKQSLDIDLLTFKTMKSVKLIPLLPMQAKLDVSYAVCYFDSKVFVCGGTTAVGEGKNKMFSVNQSAFLLDQQTGQWTTIADPIQALDSSACCKTKLPCSFLQNSKTAPTRQNIKT